MERDSRANIRRYFIYVIGIFSAIIGVLFVIGAGYIFSKINYYDSENREKGFLILSFILPFGIFFSTVGIRALNPRIVEGIELISTRSWRILAITNFLVGIICSLLGHWFGIILPGLVGFICLLKDRKFMEWLHSIGIGFI